MNIFFVMCINICGRKKDEYITSRFLQAYLYKQFINKIKLFRWTQEWKMLLILGIFTSSEYFMYVDYKHLGILILLGKYSMRFSQWN